MNVLVLLQLLFQGETLAANITLELIAPMFTSLVQQEGIFPCENRAADFALEPENNHSCQIKELKQFSSTRTQACHCRGFFCAG